MRSSTAFICLLSLTLTTLTPLQAQTYRSHPNQPVTYTAGDEHQLVENQPVESYHGMPYYSDGSDCGNCGSCGSCGSPYPPMGQTILSILSDVHYGVNNTLGISNTLSVIRQVKPARRVVSHIVPPRLALGRQKYTYPAATNNTPVEAPEQPAPAAQPVQPAPPVERPAPQVEQPQRPPVERDERANPFSDDQANYRTRPFRRLLPFRPADPAPRQAEPEAQATAPETRVERVPEMRVERLSVVRQPLSMNTTAPVTATQPIAKKPTPRPPVKPALKSTVIKQAQRRVVVKPTQQQPTEAVAKQPAAPIAKPSSTQDTKPRAVTIAKKSPSPSLLQPASIFNPKPSNTGETRPRGAFALKNLPIVRRSQATAAKRPTATADDISRLLPLKQSAIADRMQRQTQPRPTAPQRRIAQPAQMANVAPALAQPAPVVARSTPTVAQPTATATRPTPSAPKLAPIVSRPTEPTVTTRTAPAPPRQFAPIVRTRRVPVAGAPTAQPQSPAREEVSAEEWGSLGALPAAEPEETYGELPLPGQLETTSAPAAYSNPVRPMTVRPLSYNEPAKKKSVSAPATIEVDEDKTRKVNPLRNR